MGKAAIPEDRAIDVTAERDGYIPGTGVLLPSLSAY